MHQKIIEGKRQNALTKSVRSNIAKHQKAFTLIELLFVLLILGILSAIAVPKFTYLHYQSRATPIIQSYQEFLHSGISAFLNTTENNGVAYNEVNMTDLLKVSPLEPWTTSGVHKRWLYRNTSTNSYSEYYYYIDSEKYIHFRYYKKNMWGGYKRSYLYLDHDCRREEGDLSRDYRKAPRGCLWC